MPHTFEPCSPIDGFASYLDRRIPDLMAYDDIPGVSIALIRRGEVRWTGHYGYADVARRRLVDAETIFEVGSISKSVTAWGVLHLAEQGKIDLDAPVDRYLIHWHIPISPFDSDAVTIRRLLNHGSGLPEVILPAFSPNLPQPSVQTLLSDAKVVHEPGTSFLYSNYGYTILQLLIEDVTGRSFSDYMQAEILTPLGMDHSSFTWTPKLQPGMATGYLYDGLPAPENRHVAQACGGLYTTLNDLAKFVASESPGPNGEPPGRGVLLPTSVAEMQSPSIKTSGMMHGLSADAYGFGHFIESLADGQSLVSHGGQNAGWVSYYYIRPDTGDALVILTNSERSFHLIAKVVSDWAAWLNLGSVKMSRAILAAATIIQGAIVLALLITFWLGAQLMHGLVGRKRCFSLFAGVSISHRIVQTMLAFLLLASGWGVSRVSFMELFAVLREYLSGSLAACGLLMLFIVIFPKR